MRQTKVVNLRIEPYDVYIGRAGKGQDGTFGNPFNEGTREENVEAFKHHFHERIRTDPEFKRQVRQLKGKVLGCFCKPKKDCHGDVIVDYLDTLKPLKCAVVGSRTFQDYKYMVKMLGWHDISLIISGGAKGADSLARIYAREHNIPLREHIPQWDLHGKKAGFIRNKLIIDDADVVIAFWDGISRGTAHSIKLAEEANKPFYIYDCPIEDEIAQLG